MKFEFIKDLNVILILSKILLLIITAKICFYIDVATPPAENDINIVF